VLRVLPEHPQSVYGLVWVNSDILVTGCDDGKIIGHDLRSARPAWSYNLNDVLAQTCGETARRGVCSLSLLHPAQAASPNSIPIAAGCIGGYVTLFNAVSGQVLSHQQLHKDDVRSVCVMPATARPNDGSSFELLTSSYDGTVGLWKAGYGSNGSIQYVARRSLQGHGDKVLSATPVAMPGRKACDIMSSGADGKAILWSLS
jgi:WD40 repeat protein